MAGIELQQRCWNHEAREAACRCPACGRSYCRECVSEHEGRLLCAACLSRVTAGREQSSGRWRKLAPAAMIAAAILLAWLTYWAAGESVMAVIRRMQQEPRSGAAASAHQPYTALAGVGQASVFCRLSSGVVIARHGRVEKPRPSGRLASSSVPHLRHRFFMKFRGPAAPDNRPQKAMVCPTLVFHAA
jgi:hypothetical protein